MKTESRYYRSGFGMRREIRGVVDEDYRSGLVDRAIEEQHRLVAGDLTIRLARAFGFCYGVDRAVDYAYETRARFPDRRIFLTGEIIHNPKVNGRLRDLGVEILEGIGLARFEPVGDGDVVLIPAFGCTRDELTALRERGCVLVDTTCGSVLSVWKNVERYARQGFTALVHGKHDHEETRATCSQTEKYENGRYVVVRNLEETEMLCATIRGETDGETFLAHFAPHAVSPGFDPDRDLERIGCANQTTMLSSESLAIAERVRREMRDRWGDEALGERFVAFDTICSATQERQDAVRELIAERPNVMIVVGGYNSSNTGHLAEISLEAGLTVFHVDRAECIIDATRIRHLPVGASAEVEATDWLPDGPLLVGLTAGASTPNVEVGGVLERLVDLRAPREP